MLTTGQVARLMGTPLRTVTRWLTTLHTHGLVVYVRPGRQAGTAPRHWWLSVKGARLVAGVAPAAAQPSPMFARHTATIAEVWLAVREHGRSAGIEPVDWLTDRAGWQQWDTGASGRGPTVTLTPDAMLSARIEAGDTAAAIEVDLATMTQPRLREKTGRYLAYAADRAWLGVWPHCPPMLMLTTTERRATNWITIATKLAAAHRRGQGMDYRFAHQGDAGRIVAAADRLMVAACGCVHEPAAAITGRVWMVSDDPADNVTLAELLTGRVTAQAAAAAAIDRIEVRAAAARRRAALAEIARADETGRLLGEAAAEILLQLARDTAAFAAEHPELAERLLDWWPHRHDAGGDVGPVRAQLLGLHRQRWTAHARLLLQVAGDDPGDADPRLCHVADRLAQGRLLSPGQPDDVAGYRRRRSQVQADQLGGYPAHRDREVAAGWAGLGWRARRRSTREALAADHDDRELLVCQMCGILVPRRGPGQIYGDAYHCRACHHGQLIPHARRHEVPTLPDRLAPIRQRLAANPAP